MSKQQFVNGFPIGNQLNQPTQAAVLRDGLVLFQGDYDKCLAWMRVNPGWDDLRYIKDGKLWRCASYVL